MSAGAIMSSCESFATADFIPVERLTRGTAWQLVPREHLPTVGGRARKGAVHHQEAIPFLAPVLWPLEFRNARASL